MPIVFMVNGSPGRQIRSISLKMQRWIVTECIHICQSQGERGNGGSFKPWLGEVLEIKSKCYENNIKRFKGMYSHMPEPEGERKWWKFFSQFMAWTSLNQNINKLMFKILKAAKECFHINENSFVHLKIFFGRISFQHYCHFETCF